MCHRRCYGKACCCHRPSHRGPHSHRCRNRLRPRPFRSQHPADPPFLLHLRRCRLVSGDTSDSSIEFLSSEEWRLLASIRLAVRRSPEKCRGAHRYRSRTVPRPLPWSPINTSWQYAKPYIGNAGPWPASRPRIFRGFVARRRGLAERPPVLPEHQGSAEEPGKKLLRALGPRIGGDSPRQIRMAECDSLVPISDNAAIRRTRQVESLPITPHYPAATEPGKQTPPSRNEISGDLHDLENRLERGKYARQIVRSCVSVFNCVSERDVEEASSSCKTRSPESRREQIGPG